MTEMIKNKALAAPLLFAAPVLLAGCSEVDAQDEFWKALSSHCGNAYAGQLVSDDAADADMQGAEMVMHVRTCDADKITVPFHIKQQGAEWDRSRTWVFTRTDTGLRLKHDHRHEDGKADAVTMYGGDTDNAGDPARQSFPVDEESIAMFKREGLDVSVTNIWSVAVDSAAIVDGKFTYQLSRTVEGGAPEPRNFEVEFDLTTAIDAPPAPWGFEKM